MNREQILEFLNANPLCHLATCEGTQPRVRGMMLYRADAAGLIFHTGRPKALYKQLLANKQVEICFNSPDTQVRVAGVAQIVEDMSLKKEIVEAQPFMKPWVEKHGYDLLVIFRVTQCQAAVWTMATNFEPTRYQKLSRRHLAHLLWHDSDHVFRGGTPPCYWLTLRTPSFWRRAIMGHQSVKADCSRFRPTKAVKSSQ